MKSQIKKIIELIFEVGTLRRVKRSHLQILGKTEDSILDHCFRVAIIGYVLAKELGLNTDKVLKMCLFHDLLETRTGDQNWIQKRYVKVNEGKIARDQFKNLSIGKEIIDLLKEYRNQRTKEAKLAKEADVLEEIFQLREYADQGNKEAKRWIAHNSRRLRTQIGKEILKELKKSNIHDWWWRKWK